MSINETPCPVSSAEDLQECAMPTPEEVAVVMVAHRDSMAAMFRQIYETCDCAIRGALDRVQQEVTQDLALLEADLAAVRERVCRVLRERRERSLQHDRRAARRRAWIRREDPRPRRFVGILPRASGGGGPPPELAHASSRGPPTGALTTDALRTANLPT